MKKVILFVLSLIQISSFAQDADFNDFDYLRSIGYEISKQDEAEFLKLPVLELPAEYKNRYLPPVVDNSQYKYFRPIFSQLSNPNCMQSTSIAYNFTYELNRVRDLSADLPENQYTTHFAWNFYNGGDGWWGVNYLHTFNVLEKCGTPNVADYGGFYYGEGSRWMSGYDEYYNAMHNRINKIYTVPMDTELGILALKHWLYDHLEGSEYGGVASFIACSPWNLTHLPEGTPEEDKYVITQWCPEALHGMTIIGYNDSIRWDYNGDGKYTNDMDINNDGVIDPKDWEIGGFKFANSYDTTWADDGFAYMMYRTVAISVEEGGIWNNSVHVIELNEPYEPEVTLKVNMSHDSREMIKVTAGVSCDLNSNVPQYIMDFPIFNYQGGDKYMQGSDTIESNRIIEFGLDITPLLSHCNPNIPAKFFLIIDEDDPYNKGYGEMISFSVMDYTSGLNEIPCTTTNSALDNNGRSMYSAVANINFSKPDILTEDIPAYTATVPAELQLEATGGTPPYEWFVKKKYHCSYDAQAFPMIDDNELYPLNPDDSIYSIPLQFEFPFFGKKYDTVHVARYAFLYFEDEFVYWSYILKHKEFFRNVSCVSPMKAREVELNTVNNDGLWYESTPDYIAFRWNASQKFEQVSDLNMAVKLHKNGNIEFFYGDMQMKETIDWAAGISEGNGLNYHYVDYVQPFDIPNGTHIEFAYNNLPDSVSIVNDNILRVYNSQDTEIFDISILCKDQKDLSDQTTLQLTDGLMVDFVRDAGSDTIVEYGESVSYDIIVKNIGAQDINNLNLTAQTNNPFVQMTDNSEVIGSLNPGQTLTVVDALSFDLSINIPDNHHIILDALLQSQSQSWTKRLVSKVKAPKLDLQRAIVDDSNGRLDPGETSDLIIPVYNCGHARSNDLSIELLPVNNLLQVVGQSTLDIGQVNPGSTVTGSFSVFTDYSVPNGYTVQLLAKITDSEGFYMQDTLDFKVGKIPALVIDLDPNNYSGPVIKETLDRLGVTTVYAQTLPPDGIDNYQAIFVCLGVQFNSGQLSWTMGEQLAAYLDSGGRLFLEGREAWRDHVQTPAHYRFNINPIDQPAMYNNILGVDSTFTKGVQLENIASQPFSYYYTEAVPPAYVVFTNEADSLPCGVAYDQGIYKTIGTIFEFGNLFNDSSKCDTLMSRIIDFFDIVLTVSGTSEKDPVSGISNLGCYPNPMKNAARITFHLDERSEAFMEVYNMQGQKVSTILDGELMNKGKNELEWNTADDLIPAGIYFLKLRTYNSQSTIKLIIVK